MPISATKMTTELRPHLSHAVAHLPGSELEPALTGRRCGRLTGRALDQRGRDPGREGLPGVSMTLLKRVNDPIILGNECIFEGHGDLRY